MIIIFSFLHLSVVDKHSRWMFLIIGLLVIAPLYFMFYFFRNREQTRLNFPLSLFIYPFLFLTGGVGQYWITTNIYVFLFTTVVALWGFFGLEWFTGLKKEYDHKVLEKFVYEFQLFKESKENILETKISNKDLSSGQMQKISLIRALILEPEILILDEAFSNLDKFSRKLISEKLNKKEITIINSTHSTIDLDYDNHFSIEISQGQRKIVER